MTTPANWTIEQSAYDVIHTMEPSMVMYITGLLLQGQTPGQIVDFISRRDVFLAGIVQMALPVIQEKIDKASNGHIGLLKWAFEKQCEIEDQAKKGKG
jgi:hypothetical protein